MQPSQPFYAVVFFDRRLFHNTLLTEKHKGEQEVHAVGGGASTCHRSGHRQRRSLGSNLKSPQLSAFKALVPSRTRKSGVHKTFQTLYLSHSFRLQLTAWYCHLPLCCSHNPAHASALTPNPDATHLYLNSDGFMRTCMGLDVKFFCSHLLLPCAVGCS